MVAFKKNKKIKLVEIYHITFLNNLSLNCEQPIIHEIWDHDLPVAKRFLTTYHLIFNNLPFMAFVLVEYYFLFFILIFLESVEYYSLYSVMYAPLHYVPLLYLLKFIYFNKFSILKLNFLFFSKRRSEATISI